MEPRRFRLFLSLALAVLLTVLTAAGPALADPPHEEQMREIAKTLACPVCQGQTVLDSSSQLATQMREVIVEKLEAGESREAVVQYLVDRYGEGILLDPPKRGFALGIWLGPVLLALVGLAMGAATLRSRRGGAPATEVTRPGEQSRYDSWLEDELRERTPLGTRPEASAQADGLSNAGQPRGHVG